MCRLEVYQVHLSCHMGEKMYNVQVESVKDTSTNLRAIVAIG
jgi:hypothetical protein